MSRQSYLESLRSKQALLEQQISDEMYRSLPDNTVLTRLKRERLRIKDEIKRLAHSDRRAEARDPVSSGSAVLLEDPDDLYSVEEALDELERLTSQVLKATSDEVEEVRRHNREFDKILAAIQSTLDAADEEWRVSAAG